MEALTAIGLIANVIQFVDLGAKLVGSAKEMRDSASGMTLENKSLEEVTIEMRDLSSSLDPPTTNAESYDERVLRQLAQECRELSDQILRLLKKIAPTKPGSRRQIVGSLIKNQKYRKEKKELGEKLADCRKRLHLQFDKFTRLVNVTMSLLGPFPDTGIVRKYMRSSRPSEIMRNQTKQSCKRYRNRSSVFAAAHVLLPWVLKP